MRTSDILDGAFKLFKANARTLILVTSVFVVPVQLLAAFAQRELFGGEGIITFINDPASAQVESEAGDGTVLLALFAALASVIVVPLVAGAASRVVAASYLGDHMEPGPALRVVTRRWWVFLVAWVLVHVVEVVGTVMCILPGLLAMALFVAVAPVAAVEGLGPVKSMRRSARLVRPRMFRVLGIALLSGLLANVIGSALGFVPQMLGLLVGLRWGWVLLAAGNIVASVVTTPFVAIVATLVYFDARIRQEGLDLQVMAAEVTGAGPS